MKHASLFMALFGFALALMVPCGVADAAEPGWKLRLSGVWVDPDFEWLDVNEYHERQSATTSSDIGFGLGIEYRFSDRFGIELGAAWVDPEVKVTAEVPDVITISDTDSLGFNPITVALNIYVTPNSPVQVYLAPMFAYVSYGDIDVDLGMFCDPGMLCTFHFDVDNDWGWGIALGADIPLGSRGWNLNASIGYLDTAIKVTDSDGDSESFGFDPMTASLGIAYRF